MYKKAITSYPAGGLCLICKHWISGGKAGYHICSAFPDGMPEAIANAHVDHRYLFPGDNGIHFELKEETNLTETKLAEWIEFTESLFEESDMKLLQAFQYLRRHNLAAWKAFDEGKISQNELLDALTEWLLKDWLPIPWLIGRDEEWFKFENDLWVEAAPPFSIEAMDDADLTLDNVKQFNRRLIFASTTDIPRNITYQAVREVFETTAAKLAAMRESRRTFLRERYFGGSK